MPPDLIPRLILISQPVLPVTAEAKEFKPKPVTEEPKRMLARRQSVDLAALHRLRLDDGKDKIVYNARA